MSRTIARRRQRRRQTPVERGVDRARRLSHSIEAARAAAAASRSGAAVTARPTTSMSAPAAIASVGVAARS